MLQVLARYSAYAGSSSGVEQQFSQCLFLFRHLRNGAPIALQRSLVLHGARGRTGEKKSELAAAARCIWAQCFGEPRSKRRPNCPQAPRVAQPVQGNTEKGILRSWKGRAWRAQPGSMSQAQDRPSATPEAHAQRGAAPGAPSLERELWKPAQQKELERQLGLQETRRLEGADLGQDMEPLPEAQGENLEAHRKKARKTAMEYEQRQRRAAAIQDRTPKLLSLDSGVFVAEPAAQPTSTPR